jgi:predicted nuclease of restriction endonuclease-like (RecB) superfamily
VVTIRESENRRDRALFDRSVIAEADLVTTEPHAEGSPIHWEGYDDLLRALKNRIREAQVRAAQSVNRELILLYWRIGRDLLARQQRLGWGAKVIQRLAGDLRREFPDFRGLSTRNLRYMRDLARAWPDEPIWQRTVAKLPWRHNCILLDRVRDAAVRRWYLHAAIEHGWSGDVLAHQIETKLFERQGKAVSNFRRTLPDAQSELAQQMLKDPYAFDFLSLDPKTSERALHSGLLEHMRDFLVELGVGFAFVGSRQHLEVGGQDFYLDLLFYHLRLRCFVVVELKVGEFAPEHAGKMSFYLSAVDDLLRHPEDRATIGIVLCKSRNWVVAEYALRDLHKPMGIATWHSTESMPIEWKENLPSVEALEVELHRRGRK